MSELREMEDAPRNGEEIIGVHRDGTEELIFWNTDRYCMLGRRNGSYPPGWSSAEGIISSNLPLDAECFIGWKEPQGGQE